MRTSWSAVEREVELDDNTKGAQERWAEDLGTHAPLKLKDRVDGLAFDRAKREANRRSASAAEAERPYEYSRRLDLHRLLGHGVA